MKKVLAVGVAMFIAAGMTASAQMGDLGLRGGIQKLADSDGGAAFAGGGYFRWDWHRIVMMEAAVMYHVESVDASGARPASDLEIIPLQLSALIYPLRRDYTLSPYVLGGVGLYVTRIVPEAGGETDTSTDFGWHLGLGADFALNDRVFIEGDFRYIWLDTNSEGTAADVLSSFDSWMATIGIGFRL